jgi:hypothetical protein
MGKYNHSTTKVHTRLKDLRGTFASLAFSDAPTTAELDAWDLIDANNGYDSATIAKARSRRELKRLLLIGPNGVELLGNTSNVLRSIGVSSDDFANFRDAIRSRTWTMRAMLDEFPARLNVPLDDTNDFPLQPRVRTDANTLDDGWEQMFLLRNGFGFSDQVSVIDYNPTTPYFDYIRDGLALGASGETELDAQKHTNIPDNETWVFIETNPVQGQSTARLYKAVYPRTGVFTGFKTLYFGTTYTSSLPANATSTFLYRCRFFIAESHLTVTHGWLPTCHAGTLAETDGYTVFIDVAETPEELGDLPYYDARVKAEQKTGGLRKLGFRAVEGVITGGGVVHWWLLYDGPVTWVQTEGATTVTNEISVGLGDRSISIPPEYLVDKHDEAVANGHSDVELTAEERDRLAQTRVLCHILLTQRTTPHDVLSRTKFYQQCRDADLNPSTQVFQYANPARDIPAMSFGEAEAVAKGKTINTLYFMQQSEPVSLPGRVVLLGTIGDYQVQLLDETGTSLWLVDGLSITEDQMVQLIDYRRANSPVVDEATGLSGTANAKLGSVLGLDETKVDELLYGKSTGDEFAEWYQITRVWRFSDIPEHAQNALLLSQHAAPRSDLGVPLNAILKQGFITSRDWNVNTLSLQL